MSDEATTPSKRGRKQAAADKSPDKIESKKRQRKEVKHIESGDEDGAAAPKRGRGRPKGSTKKKAAPKAKGGRSSAGRRGRPKKDDKGKDSGDEDNEENDAGDDEDD